ncbi:MAG: HAMP domain-containing sensor histidine kinase [Chloroflexota bacterium]|nr:HAMP domain-containing sensor histidine kinase [Chloroflexota bacterium]
MLRTLLRRYALPFTIVATLLIAAAVIFITLSVGLTLRQPDALTFVAISVAAAFAIVGVRVALDVLVALVNQSAASSGGTTSRIPIVTMPLNDQTQRMDELMTLNIRLAAVNRDLGAAKEQIEKLDSVKTDFITIASHELRTPLAQMRGYTDIIDALNESGALDREKLGAMASNLRKATERMEELIGAMLDTSQIDVDAMDLRYTPGSLESIVRMAIDPLGDAIRERKILLRASGLSGLPMLQGDMQRLVQAFRNVIVNAVKFTPDGGRIDIRAELDPDSDSSAQRLHVVVKDTGVGIAAENLELIFHKFYRAYDPQRHSTGSYKFMGAGPGLGLTIARGIIDGHGGRIWAESPGHDMTAAPGTTFHIVLPVTPPEEARRILPFEKPTAS